HFAVAGAGTNHHAQAGTIKHPEHQQSDKNTHGRDKQAVYGVGHDFAQMHRASQPGRNRHTVDVVAHEDAAQFFKNKNKPVSHEHLLQVFAGIQVTVEGPFKKIAQYGGQHDADQYGNDKAPAQVLGNKGLQREGHIGPDHI